MRRSTVWRRPRTLLGQLLLAVLLALVVTQLVGAWLIQEDRDHFVRQMRSEYLLQRLANIVQMLDRTPTAERARLLKVINDPPGFLSLGEPWRHPAADTGDSVALSQAFSRQLGRPGTLQIIESPHQPPLAIPGAEEPGHGLQEHMPPLSVMQTRLRDGTVLTVRHHPLPGVRDWPGRTMLLLWVLALTVALLAALALRRLTRPLAALADAATGLAGNLDQPPLSEDGPVEVARAARAFNRMQHDLRLMIETRDQALAGVSHDLRLPITRLRLRLEALPQQDLRTRIAADLTEMDAMIGDTLDFLRAGKPSEPVARMNLDALVDTLCEDFAELGLEIRLHGQIGKPVAARPNALRRCLSNLLENARRYGDGSVDLTLRRHDAHLDILIEDRGPGIPEAERQRVFEPYYRLESSRAKATGGSGLGLAIARAIARAEGGDLSLSERTGGGLSVRLSLPLR